MAYEHQKEANQVAANVMDAIKMLTDDVPDQQQIAQLLADGTAIIAGVTTGLAAEDKEAYKAKFIAAVGLAVANRALGYFLPDSES